MRADRTDLTHDDPRKINALQDPQNHGVRSGFIQAFKCMYGKEAHDEKLAQLWDADRLDTFKYPHQGKRVLLLISAILPYMIVSRDHNPRSSRKQRPFASTNESLSRDVSIILLLVRNNHFTPYFNIIAVQ